MKIEEFLERVGAPNDTYGRVIEYLKDGLVELNMQVETHMKTSVSDIQKNARHYPKPYDLIKVVDIRVKGHRNSDDEYKSIPRMIQPPANIDTDDDVLPRFINNEQEESTS